MDDLTITRLCAEAMGYSVSSEDAFETCGLWCHLPAEHGVWYRPLSGDLYGNSQCMALVKKFRLMCKFSNFHILPPTFPVWIAAYSPHPEHGIYQIDARNEDLNRACCLCVAQMNANAKGK